MDAVKKLEAYKEYGLRTLNKYNFFKNIYFIYEKKWKVDAYRLFLNKKTSLIKRKNDNKNYG